MSQISHTFFQSNKKLKNLRPNDNKKFWSIDPHSSKLGIPYIFAYKSRNFGQILTYFFSIRLIRGSKNLAICCEGEEKG